MNTRDVVGRAVQGPCIVLAKTVTMLVKEYDSSTGYVLSHIAPSGQPCRHNVSERAIGSTFKLMAKEKKPRKTKAVCVSNEMRRHVRDQIRFVQSLIDLATDTKDCTEATRKALYDVRYHLDTCARRVDVILRGEELPEEAP